jgi:hypothetical protein
MPDGRAQCRVFDGRLICNWKQAAKSLYGLRPLPSIAGPETAKAEVDIWSALYKNRPDSFCYPIPELKTTLAEQVSCGRVPRFLSATSSTLEDGQHRYRGLILHDERPAGLPYSLGLFSKSAGRPCMAKDARFGSDARFAADAPSGITARLCRLVFCTSMPSGLETRNTPGFPALETSWLGRVEFGCCPSPTEEGCLRVLRHDAELRGQWFVPDGLLARVVDPRISSADDEGMPLWKLMDTIYSMLSCHAGEGYTVH